MRWNGWRGRLERRGWLRLRVRRRQRRRPGGNRGFWPSSCPDRAKEGSIDPFGKEWVEGSIFIMGGKLSALSPPSQQALPSLLPPSPPRQPGLLPSPTSPHSQLESDLAALRPRLLALEGAAKAREGEAARLAALLEQTRASEYEFSSRHMQAGGGRGVAYI